MSGTSRQLSFHLAPGRSGQCGKARAKSEAVSSRYARIARSCIGTATLNFYSERVQELLVRSVEPAVLPQGVRTVARLVCHEGGRSLVRWRNKSELVQITICGGSNRARARRDVGSSILGFHFVWEGLAV